MINVGDEVTLTKLLLVLKSIIMSFGIISASLCFFLTGSPDVLEVTRTNFNTWLGKFYDSDYYGGISS